MTTPVLTPTAGRWPAAHAPGRRPTALDRHALLLPSLLLLFAAVWLLHLDHASLAPPADNIEQLTWIGSLEAGYHKHPPLPTWLLWLPARLFGASARTSYAMGAACVLATMGVLWQWLARLRGRRHATLAVLAALCVTFYNGRLYYYNHNVVLMPLVAAGAALGWQALSSGRLRWWAALGVCLGLGALAKYQVALAAAALLACWLRRRGWRDAAQRRGLLLAALLALLVVAPHLRWLAGHDFAPVRYALQSSLGAGLDGGARLGGSAHWLLDQLFNRALPAWALLAFAARARPKVPAGAAAGKDDGSRWFLLCWGTLPLALTAALGVVAGAELQLHWGTAFLPLAVPAAMELVGRRDGGWRRAPLAPALKAFAAIQLGLLLVSHLTSPHGPAPLRSHHWRNFDAAALADALAEPARERLGGPIRVVVGPGAPAGALSLNLAERPLVLIDGRHDASPWVAPGLVAHCGALELGHTDAPGWQPVGAGFAGLSWRVVEPVAGRAPCPAP